jgi:predicted Rossmann-fold nucleotide-binding protein
VGLLDAEGFFAPLLAMADAMVREGFVRPEDRAMIAVAREPEALLDLLARDLPPVAVKWGGAR